MHVVVRAPDGRKWGPERDNCRSPGSPLTTAVRREDPSSMSNARRGASHTDWSFGHLKYVNNRSQQTATRVGGVLAP